MLNPDEMKCLDIEIKLAPTERALLAAQVTQEGFDILQRLMEDQVRKFNLKLINTEASQREDVLANHALAKAVAQFYVGLIKRIEEECDIHYNGRNVEKDEVLGIEI